MPAKKKPGRPKGPKKLMFAAKVLPETVKGIKAAKKAAGLKSDGAVLDEAFANKTPAPKPSTRKAK